MKAGKLIALGFSGILAAAGVTVATFEGQELTGYVDPVGIVTTCYAHTETAVVGKEYKEDFSLTKRDIEKCFKYAEILQILPKEKFYREKLKLKMKNSIKRNTVIVF